MSKGPNLPVQQSSNRPSLRPLARPALLSVATLVSFASIATLTKPGDTTYWTGACLLATSSILFLLTAIATLKAIYYSPALQQTIETRPRYLVISFSSIIVCIFIIANKWDKIGDSSLQLVFLYSSTTVIMVSLVTLAIFSVLLFKLKSSE